MKFVTFLKIFTICLFSLIGVFGAGYGIMALTGKYTEPDIFPKDISFEFNEYNKSEDFTMTINTTSTDSTRNSINLSFDNVDIITFDSANNTITDGVVTIPKEVEIGVPFSVKLNKINDDELDGQSWITGGHSIIKAQSENEMLAIARTVVNVDVPVYSTEIKFSSPENTSSSTEFAVQSKLNASLKFIPLRSEFAYSKDGTQGYSEVKKNTYFSTQSNMTGYVEQVDCSNVFNTIALYDGVGINGYCFKTSTLDEYYNELYNQQSEEDKFTSLLSKLSELNNTEDDTKKVSSSSGEFSIVKVNVDTMTVGGVVTNVDIDSVCTLYASKEITGTMNNCSNLDILLQSSINTSVSMQTKLSEVGIKIYVQIGSNKYDAINGDLNYKCIDMVSGGYGSKNEDGYYFPIVTSNPNNSYWNFAVTNKTYTDYIVEVKYFDNDSTLADIPVVLKSFSTKPVARDAINWTNAFKSSDTVLKIYDQEIVEYEELDLSAFAQVPTTNLYQTRKYFAYSNNGDDLFNSINCLEGVSYRINNQDLTLYEIPNGILRAKSANANDLNVQVIFATVETSYSGAIKTIAGDGDSVKYIISQYSQSAIGEISFANVLFEKTVKDISAEFGFAGETTLAPMTNIDDGYYAYFTQSINNAFDIKLSVTSDISIFETAILNGDISIIAKVNGSDSDLITVSSKHKSSESTEEKCIYVFTMETNELAVGQESAMVELFVKYKKSNQVTQETKISSNLVDAESNTYKVSTIEIYNGEATVFNFSANVDEGQIIPLTADSQENRINVETTIASGSIITTYKIGTIDVKDKLYGDEDESLSIQVSLKDKHGQLPVINDYIITSSNTSIMIASSVVNDENKNINTITFVGAGEVNLYLRNVDGEIKDTLYFNSVSEGSVSSVIKLKEIISDGASVYSTDTVYTENSTEYDFTKQTVQIVGYSGNEINLTSTETDVINLIKITYKTGNNNIDITSKLKYSFKTISDILKDKYLEINNGKLTLLKDFGVLTTVELIAQIPELGISQVVELVINPNISVQVTPEYNCEQSKIEGVLTYSGVYSSTDFIIDVVETKQVLTAGETYGWYISENANEIGRLVNSNENVTYTSTPGESDSPTVEKFVFKDQSEYKTYILTYAKTVGRTAYDIQKVIYIYVVPNAKISYNHDTVNYLTATGVDLKSVIEISRILGNLDFEENTYAIVQYLLKNVNVGDNVTGLYTKNENTYLPVGSGATAQPNIKYYQKIDTATNFEITSEGFLKLKDNCSISELTTLYIKAYLNGFNIQSGATYKESHEGYYATIKVAPDIKVNTEENNAVLYDGEWHIALENNKTYYDTTVTSPSDGAISLKGLFNDSGIKTVSVSQIVNGDGYSANTTVGEFTILGITDRLDFSLQITVTLNNGSSLTFPVILMPSLNLVDYTHKEEKELDLKDLLSVEYLIENIGTENEIAESIGISGDLKLEDDKGVYITDSTLYSTQNIDENDSFGYVSFTNGSQYKAIRVGVDKYVILFAQLSNLPNALKIPYLVKLESSLQMESFYPYDNNGENINLSGTEIRDNEYSKEYLSFGSNGVVVINFSENQNRNVPNKSVNGTRYNLYYLNEVNEKKTEDNQTIMFNVEEVWYKTALLGWRQAPQVNTFANFSSVNTSELTLNNTAAAGVIALRVKVRIFTQTGAEAYYYISVGEIPTLTLIENSSIIETNRVFEIIAGAENTDFISSLKLQSVTGTTAQDFTSLLDFYCPDFKTIETGNENYLTFNDSTITAIKSVNNLNTNLVVYTKFGNVKIIPTIITSNYSFEITTDINIETTTELDIYDLREFNLIDITVSVMDNGSSSEQTYNISKIALTNTLLEANAWDKSEDYNNVDFADFDSTFSKLKIGVVELNTVFYVTIITNLQEFGELYTFTFPVNVHPSISVAEYEQLAIDSRNPYQDVRTHLADNDIEIDILNLFNISDENSDALSNGKIEFIVIEGDKAISKDTNAENEIKFLSEKITIKTQDISADTTVFICVYISSDIGGYIIESYFRLTVKCNFALTINYPNADPSNESPEKELFYAGGVEPKTLKLSEESYLGAERVIVKKLALSEGIIITGDTYLPYIKIISNINEVNLTGITTESIVLYNTPIGLNGDGIVEIGIYLDSEATLQIGTYIVDCKSRLGDVWGVTTNNLFTNTTNSVTNPEIIHWQVLDNSLFNVVKVSYRITSAQKSYIQFGFINEDVFQPITFDTGLNYIEQGITSPRTDSVVGVLPDAITDYTDWVITCKIYASLEADSGNLQDEITNPTIVNVTDIDVFGRAELTYYGQRLSFADNYKLVLRSGSAPKVEGFQALMIEEIGEVGNYYYNYLPDVVFDNTETTLYAGQKYSILKDKNNNYNNLLSYYMGSFGMKHVYNGKDYTSEETIQMSITEKITYRKNTNGIYVVDVSGISYLRYEIQYFGEENKICDIMFFAQGAPNESIQERITVEFSFAGNEYSETFIINVKNDYDPIILKNNDGSVNNEYNRFIIQNDLCDDSGNLKITFSLYNSLVEESGNYIILGHTFSAQVNVASLFGIKAEQNGEYVTKYTTNNNLLFSFKKIKFGDKNIDLVFSDAYGFTFEYFILIRAENTPSYTGSQIILYEEDEFTVCKVRGSVDTTYIPINFTGNTFTMNSSNTTLSFIKTGETEGVEDFLETVSPDDDNLVYKIKPLSFGDKESMSGKLYIKFTTDDASVSTISIDLTIKKRYSFQQTSNDLVRDGVNFSLIEIIEVIDNKTYTAIGERYLENVNTITTQLVTGSVSGYDIAIKLKNRIDNNYQYVPIEINGFSLTANILEDIFTSEFDMTLYQFSLAYKSKNDDSYTDMSPVDQSKKDIVLGEKRRFIFENVTIEASLQPDVMVSIYTPNLGADSQMSLSLVTSRGETKNIAFDCSSSGYKTVSMFKNFEESFTVDTIGFKYRQGTSELDTYIKGLTLAELALLNSVEYKKYDGETLGSDNIFQDKLYLDKTKTFKTIEGSEISYQEQQVTYQISKNNILQNLSCAFKVGLKYIGVDTVQAYGTEKVRIINVPASVSNSEGKLKSNLVLELTNWAGKEGENPFMLIAGLSNVQEFAALTGEDLVMSSSGTSLSFSLTTARDDVSILEDNSIKFNQGFKYQDNYVSIDVFVNYPNGSEDPAAKKIATIQIGLRSVANWNVYGGSVQGTETDSKWTVSLDNIKKAVKIEIGGNFVKFNDSLIENFNFKLYTKDINDNYTVLSNEIKSTSSSLDLYVKLDDETEYKEVTLRIQEGNLPKNIAIEDYTYYTDIIYSDTDTNSAVESLKEFIQNSVIIKDIYGDALNLSEVSITGDTLTCNGLNFKFEGWGTDPLNPSLAKQKFEIKLNIGSDTYATIIATVYKQMEDELKYTKSTEGTSTKYSFLYNDMSLNNVYFVYGKSIYTNDSGDATAVEYYTRTGDADTGYTYTKYSENEFVEGTTYYYEVGGKYVVSDHTERMYKKTFESPAFMSSETIAGKKYIFIDPREDIELQTQVNTVSNFVNILYDRYLTAKIDANVYNESIGGEITLSSNPSKIEFSLGGELIFTFNLTQAS